MGTLKERAHSARFSEKAARAPRACAFRHFGSVQATRYRRAFRRGAHTHIFERPHWNRCPCQVPSANVPANSAQTFAP